MIARKMSILPVAWLLFCLPATPQAKLEGLIEKYVQLVAGHDDKLPDLSLPAIQARIAEQKELLAAARSVPPEGLSPEQVTDREILISQLEWVVREAERRKPWETNPAMYVPFSAISALVERERVPSLTTLLQTVPRMLDQGRANLKNPPKPMTQDAIFQTQGTIRLLKDQVPGQASQQAIVALESFQTFLEKDLLPRSTGSFALGREDYDFILKRRWFLKDNANTILARAKKVFAETEKMAQEVAARIEPGKDWIQVYEHLKDDHPPGDKMKDAYRAQIDAAQAFVVSHKIVTLPQGENFAIIDTPPAMRRSSPFGTTRSVGPFEKSVQGYLVLTPVDESFSPAQRQERMRSHHTAWIPIIAVHEGYPGHHVHALKINENPRLLRRVVHESVMSEGWGLFTEEMMFEEGFLKGDDVRLTQLRNVLWRAARVIIDAGIHTGSMTVEEGVQFLVDKVRFERLAAELEVGMYVRRPTYVLGYLVGKMEIQDIRARYYQKFGKPAEPRQLYDKMLRMGAIPPGLVRRELLGETVTPGRGGKP